MKKFFYIEAKAFVKFSKEGTLFVIFVIPTNEEKTSTT